MLRIIMLLISGLALLSQSALAQAPDVDARPKHGGNIESKYDGFKYETLMRLRKMKVTCDGLRDTFKGSCVSIEVTLHLPGSQLNYVRNVTMQIVFENKDWVHIHPPEQRDLSISIETETFRLGRMRLITNTKPGNWQTKVETLEATFPYATFKKIIESPSVEIQVGRSAMMLRDKNIAALRDLNSRVLVPRSSDSTGRAATTLSRSPDR